MRDLSSLAKAVAGLLVDREQTVSVSESAAGGLISAGLLAIPGASKFFVGGGVIYTRKARAKLLQLPEGRVKMQGATEEYALVAARAMRKLLGTDWALAESGTAGPTGNSYGDDPGHAAFAVAGPIERTVTLETGLDDREDNMWTFAAAGLGLLQVTLSRYSGIVVVYGIPNCDKCRAALKWLESEKIEHRFHDLRRDGLDPSTLNDWIGHLGVENVVNRNSRTWRELPEEMRHAPSPVGLASLVLAKPTLIRRPVFDLGDEMAVGFNDRVKTALLKTR
jgi:Spx/MgsR family transcriptional regulator